MYPDARVGIVLTLKCKSTTPGILFKQHGLGYPPVCEDWGYKGQGWRGTSPPPPAGAWSPRGARSWARRSPPGSWRRSPASPSPPAAPPRQAATSSSAWRSSPAPAGIVNFRYTQKMAAWKVNRYLALIGLVLGWSEVVVSRIYELSLWLIRRRCRCLHLGWRWPGYIYPGTVWPHLYSGPRPAHTFHFCWAALLMLTPGTEETEERRCEGARLRGPIKVFTPVTRRDHDPAEPSCTTPAVEIFSAGWDRKCGGQ